MDNVKKCLSKEKRKKKKREKRREKKEKRNKSYFALACIKVDNLEMKVEIDLEKAWK